VGTFAFHAYLIWAATFCGSRMSFDKLHTLAIAATMMLDTRMDTRKTSARVKYMDIIRQQANSATTAQQQVPVQVLDIVIRKELGNQSGRGAMAAQQEQPQQLLGLIVNKEFPDKRGRYAMYRGQVVSVSCVKDDEPAYNFGGGVTSTIKYEVLYDDGDSEDMTYSEVLMYIV
jgi:hypothetical protein